MCLQQYRVPGLFRLISNRRHTMYPTTSTRQHRVWYTISKLVCVFSNHEHIFYHGMHFVDIIYSASAPTHPIAFPLRTQRWQERPCSFTTYWRWFRGGGLLVFEVFKQSFFAFFMEFRPGNGRNQASSSRNESTYSRKMPRRPPPFSRVAATCDIFGLARCSIYLATKKSWSQSHVFFSPDLDRYVWEDALQGLGRVSNWSTFNQ